MAPNLFPSIKCTEQFVRKNCFKKKILRQIAKIYSLKICSKINRKCDAIEIVLLSYCCCYCVFIVNFRHISHLLSDYFC